MKTRQELINAVIEQMKDDINTDDLTAIEELLKYVPDENLENYLPEN